MCRDIKPENLLLKSTTPCNKHDRCAQPGLEADSNKPLGVEDLHLRLIDFGSAVDKHSAEQLYGSEGPSDDEQTAEYAPPEALLQSIAACSMCSTVFCIFC